MAVTAHWIEGCTINTTCGNACTLKLRADLVGFCPVPGNHTGTHMANVFLHVTDRLGITNKVCN